MTIREQLAPSILASGLDDWVYLLSAVGHARLLGVADYECAVGLAADVIRELHREGLVRVGRPDPEGGFREFDGDVDALLREAVPRYRESRADSGGWEFYVWVEDTPEGAAKAKAADGQDLLRRLGTA